ncbi:MAG: tetratricopeptide repeat protein [Bacteroidales bacterium]|nr:tetratricopeptide repeat protein [Bacteroidales bacterium]
MASIIPGLDYDVFISYRQKDNKYDGWVTEFIHNLQRELEATFKEDISIYFDENPHDGLLEIHNVDKSLESKLKAVIFIPVISQTYCDPKSFAWQNEFVAFNKMAGEDQYGRDIILPNGNVCSRIIPVKIHELDPADTELIEKELGCRLRSIDFIFSGAGVNRPLTPYDNPEKNLNKTYYRDQINKVANALKEIIYGLHPDEKKRITKTYRTRAQEGYIEKQPWPLHRTKEKSKWVKGNIMVPVVIGLLVILSIIYLIPKLSHSAVTRISKDKTLNKAIAVMPVDNFTGDSTMSWIADMIQSDLTGQLQGISNLTVRPKQTTMQFRNSVESVQNIASKISVDNLIEASIKGTGENLQVEVRVVEAFPEEKYLYHSSFNLTFSELANIYKDITNRILKEMEVKTTKEEKKIIKARSVNPGVRRACATGMYYMNQMTREGFEKGVEFYKEAIELDPANPEPYIGLAVGYASGGHGAALASLETAKSHALKAIELDPEEMHPSLADAHNVLAEWYLYHEFDFDAAEHHIERAVKLNPNSAPAHYTNGWYLGLINRVDEAILEMKKAIEIDPLNPTCIGYLAWFCQWYGNYDDAVTYANDLLKVRPGHPLAYYIVGLVDVQRGRYEEAIDTLKKTYAPRSAYACGLGVAYALAGEKDKALEIAKEIEAQNMRWHLWSLAEIYYAIGDTKKAMDWVEEAYKQKHDCIPWLVSNPYYNKLADDPRFHEVVKSLNLPEPRSPI